MSPPKSSTFGGFEDRTAAGISGLRRLQSRRVRGAQAKRLSSPARCCGWEIGNQCEQVYELSDFAIKYLVIRLLIMICIVGCGMKPAGAIPHRAKFGPAGQGSAGDGACGRGRKRGRPFPRAARSLRQPPQLAGSAAAPPALTELTPFQNKKRRSVSQKHHNCSIWTRLAVLCPVDAFPR